jgi:1-acyl-sn-glycerol-3-phosphate acyltransferase
LPFQFRILAKKELWPIAFIGWYLGRSGQIPIDTRNPRATLSSLGAGVKALRSGMPLFVFPEGGRTPNGELQNFLSGAAYLAIRAQVPLVPIALSGVYDLLPIHTRHLYPGELTLAAGDAIDTAGMTVRQTDELTERLRAAIQELSGQPETTNAQTEVSLA